MNGWSSWAVGCALAMLALAFSPTRNAHGAVAPPTIKRPLTDLVAGQITVKLSELVLTEATQPPDACIATPVNETKDDVQMKLVYSAQHCDGLLGIPPGDAKVSVKLKDNSFRTFVLRPTGNFQSETVFDLETDGKVIKTKLPPGPKTLFWSAESNWFSTSLGDAVQPALPEKVADWLAQQGDKQPPVAVNFTVRDVFAQSDVQRARLKKTQSEEPKKATPPRNWCPRSSGQFKGYTVCIDLYSPVTNKKRRQIEVFPAGTNHILRPNRAMRVFVLRPKSATVALELGGDEGIFVPKDNVQVGPSGETEKHALKPGQPSLEPDFDIEQQEFAPRLPGTANLTVSLTREGQAEERRVVEFLVDQAYLGAVRLGIGVVFGGAVDRGYEARAVSGSPQSEVVATSNPKANIEVVLGYSAYLTPRSYANTNWLRFEPYVGIGILNDSPTGIQTLKSLHAGVEWEPTPNFAIALTGVARRVTRLQDGVHIGSPVSGSVPTAETIGLGAGIVFNLSPEFFRVARSSGSSFFE